MTTASKAPPGPDLDPDSPAPGQQLLTIPQAARYLGVSRTTVYQLLARKRLRAKHIGRAARIHVRELERYATSYGR